MRVVMRQSAFVECRSLEFEPEVTTVRDKINDADGGVRLDSVWRRWKTPVLALQRPDSVALAQMSGSTNFDSAFALLSYSFFRHE